MVDPRIIIQDAGRADAHIGRSMLGQSGGRFLSMFRALCYSLVLAAFLFERRACL